MHTEAGWLVSWVLPPARKTLNTAMLVDHDKYPNGAYLGSYVNKNYKIFRCPADQSKSPPIFGFVMPRVRSVSMNNFIGTMSAATTGGTPAKYPTYQKTTSILSPTLTFVILDERADAINDGTFFTSMGTSAASTFPSDNIIDVPASYHGGAAGLSFCGWAFRNSQMAFRPDYQANWNRCGKQH